MQPRRVPTRFSSATRLRRRKSQQDQGPLATSQARMCPRTANSGQGVVSRSPGAMPGRGFVARRVRRGASRCRAAPPQRRCVRCSRLPSGGCSTHSRCWPCSTRSTASRRPTAWSGGPQLWAPFPRTGTAARGDLRSGTSKPSSTTSGLGRPRAATVRRGMPAWTPTGPAHEPERLGARVAQPASTSSSAARSAASRTATCRCRSSATTRPARSRGDGEEVIRQTPGKQPHGMWARKEERVYGATPATVAGWASLRDIADHPGIGLACGRGRRRRPRRPRGVARRRDRGAGGRDARRHAAAPGRAAAEAAPGLPGRRRAAAQGADAGAVKGDLKAKVEVLGQGQQFVAFGIHPDTGQPYV